MARRLGTRVLAVAVALACCFGFSGCFLWNSFQWSKPTVKAGKHVTATIGQTAVTDEPPRDKLVQFFLIGLPDSDPISVDGARKWDVKGNFGGPKTMFADGALRNAAINSDQCALGGPLGTKPIDVTDTDWVALRTEKEINDRDKTRVLALSKVALKAAANASDTQAFVYFFTGGWHDEDDGQPESDEVGCGGGTITSMTIR